MTEKANVPTTELTPDRLSQLRRALEAKRDELRRKSQENIAVATAAEEPQSEEAESAQDETRTGELLSLAEQQSGVLEEIDAALERMKQGTYGTSEISGRPIPFRRLLAVPWARNDAQEEEVLERQRRH
jgi:DnaK suppressor protein